MLSRKFVFWTSNGKHVIKYDVYVKFPRFFCTMYKYVLNSVVKISMMFAGARTIVTIGLSLRPIVALSDDYRSR